MRVHHARGLSRVAAMLALFAATSTRSGLALPVAADVDRDGYLDQLETLLGSSPSDATKTPESVANPPACLAAHRCRPR